MSVLEKVKKDYSTSAITYNDYSNLPSGRLESQLIRIALGDCANLKILDLGGGTGLHARQAIELGADCVDVVDISHEMLQMGRNVEASLNRRDLIRFYEADVSKSITHLPLRSGGYDVVMANWIFSFAENVDVLEGMFRNIVAYLKPGGRFIGVRDADPWSPALRNGKYGGSCTWIDKIPGGVKYLCVLHCEPPIEFEGVSLEVIYSGTSEMYERFGLSNITIVPYESAETVQRNPDFWELFLIRPNLAVVQALKALN
ncbi:S-adenosyl-L-methionine-dependent methyltransferase [Glarea lozoyensis ATCC 20868]|uniref:S-adenosyl-L-methionine-dependent methyltransferase n=1 Tax=Glarea lozoyensis (strain ATCC 20868 / MF5171) TaxID=1116229 RepID=S3DSX1_GLAL2|nr:S-adenosyl-L-methionine-dependent methyltransferase [Glarea lozoyensis ATCC 20868]EPE35076.1 S-adenosyl-L-methionine-dependent methyltransferase [Glarea lozoyensis ATCC 20868]